MKTPLKIFLLFLLTISIYENADAQKPVTWQKSYSINANPELVSLRGIAEKDNGGFISVGYNEFSRMFALSVNAYGDSLWYKTYDYAKPLGILNNNDSFYIFTLYGQMIKIDSSGNVLWDNLPITNFYANQFKLMRGNLYICGNSTSGTPLFLKKNLSGINIFYKVYEEFYQATLKDFIEVNDEFYSYGNFFYNSNDFVLKSDSAGNIITKSYFWSALDGNTLMKDLNSANIIIGGNIGSQAALIKTNLSGEIIWTKIYDPGEPYHGDIYQLQKDINGNLISFGYIDEPFFHMKSRLIKFDFDGKKLWEKIYGYEDDQLFAGYLIQTKDSGFAFTGDRSKLGYNFQITKTDKFGNVVTSSIKSEFSDNPKDIFLFQNYPNPFNSSTKIKFKLQKRCKLKIFIYDLNGKLIQKIEEKIYNIGMHEILYSPQNLSSGVYFFTLETVNQSLISKFIYLK